MDTLVLLCILCAVGRAVSAPTQAEICADPTFDGGISIFDPLNVSNTKEYLFRGQYVMPYFSNRHQIDWQKIVSISDLFTDTPQTTEGIRYGFAAKDRVYLSFKKDENKISVYEQNGNKFSRKSVENWSSVGFEFIRWNVATRLPGTPNLVTKTMYFFDATPKAASSEKQHLFKYTDGTGPKTYEIKMVVNKELDSKRLQNYTSIFPNTMIYKNPNQRSIKIPIEFDGYYQTKRNEIVFFKGSAACVQPSQPTSPNDSQYCHSFVDTRTIIGCTTEKPADSGVEAFAEEPEDKEPNF